MYRTKVGFDHLFFASSMFVTAFEAKVADSALRSRIRWSFSPLGMFVLGMRAWYWTEHQHRWEDPNISASPRGNTRNDKNCQPCILDSRDLVLYINLIHSILDLVSSIHLLKGSRKCCSPSLVHPFSASEWSNQSSSASSTDRSSLHNAHAQIWQPANSWSRSSILLSWTSRECPMGLKVLDPV